METKSVPENIIHMWVKNYIFKRKIFGYSVELTNTEYLNQIKLLFTIQIFLFTGTE